MISSVSKQTCLIYSSWGLTWSLSLSPSVRPRSASASGSYEHMMTSSGPQWISGSPAHTHPSPNPSSLGLLQLVSEHGISASTRPISPLTQKALAAHTSTLDFGRTEQSNRKQTHGSIFSLNLVDKLRSLGLYKVVARGLVDFSRKGKLTEH